MCPRVIEKKIKTAVAYNGGEGRNRIMYTKLTNKIVLLIDCNADGFSLTLSQVL
jgi:hypothetical protein